MMDKITIVRDAMLLVLPKAVFHYFAPDKTKAPYIVWAEDDQADSLHTGNSMAEQAIQGTIDYFTKQEYDPTVKKIQRALAVKQIAFRLSSIQFEKETKLIHYEWIWEVAG